MCGIAGYCGDGSSDLLNDMLESIEYRGPDQSGTYMDLGVGLGNRRLSIIGIESGKQPIHNEDESVWVVYNGEIYNYQSLRDDLEEEGHDFYTETDTEVIVHAYEEYGRDCVSKFNGMFAFALWDANEEELFLARDRIGIKPLYYMLHDGTLYFGSEIKPILQADVPREVNMDALRQYVTYRCVIDDQTPVQGVRKLPPGHTMVYDGETTVIKQYWDVDGTPQNKSPATIAAETKELLQDAVEKRMIAEVPIGAFLSGGLDSSAVVALMSQVVDDPLQTYSAGFEGHEEHEYAELVADHAGAEHTSFNYTYDELIDIVPDVVHHLDEPMADPAVFPSYLLAEKVKDKATVFLLGEGADELFGGYSEYYTGSSYGWCVPDAVKQKLFTRFRRPMKNIDFLQREHTGRYRELQQYYEDDGAFLDRITAFDLKHSIPNFQCAKVDRMSMAHSLEARVPFLDHRVVEHARTIPAKYKMKGFNEKWILKRAMQDVLPKKIIQRKKQVFFTPVQNWMQRAARGSEFDILRDSRLAANGIVDEQGLATKLDSNKYYEQYMLYMLEHWYRAFIDGEHR